MKKRILSFVFAILMVASASASVANVAEGSPATIGRTVVFTGDAAVNNWSALFAVPMDDWSSVLAGFQLEIKATMLESGDGGCFHLVGPDWTAIQKDFNWGAKHAAGLADGSEQSMTIDLTQEILDGIAAHGGLSFQGVGFTVKEITVVDPRYAVVNANCVKQADPWVMDDFQSFLATLAWSGNGCFAITREGAVNIKGMDLKLNKSVLRFYKEASTTGQCKICEPTSWGEIIIVADWDGGKDYVEAVVDQKIMDCFTGKTSDGWGPIALIVQGEGLKVNDVVLYTPFTTPIVDSMVIMPKTTYEYAGEPIFPEVIVKEGGDTLVKDSAYVLEGEFNKQVGSNAILYVKGVNDYSGTVTRTFNIIAKTATADMVSVDTVYGFRGQAIVPEFVIKNGKETLVEGTDYKVTLADNDKVGVGSYTLDFYGNYTGQLTGKLHIQNPDTLRAENVEVTPSYVYANAAIEAAVVVKFGGDTLVEGVDYTVAYENNVTITDTAKVTVQGINIYEGAVTKTFAITPYEMVDSLVSLSGYRFLNENKAIEPAVTAVFGKYTLVELDDYDVVYADNDSANTAATATVTFKGNYAGEIVKTFAIFDQMNDSVLTAKLAATEFVYSGNENKPAVEVVDSFGYKLVEKVDFTVAYPADVKSAAKDTAIVTFQGIYAGSKALAYKVLPLTADSLTIEVAAKVVVIDDSTAVEPAVKVLFGKEELKADADYVLAFANNVGVSDSAYAEFAFKGNFKDTVKVPFEVVAPDTLRGIATMASDSYVYSSDSLVTPLVVVNYLDSVRVLGKEYDVVYAGNAAVTTDSTKAMAVVTYKGFLTGSDTLYYAITPKVIADSLVSLKAATVEWYMNDTVAPEANDIKDGKYELEFDKDFDMAVEGGFKVGDVVTVSVTFKGNYKNEKDSVPAVVKYTVVARNFKAEDFTVECAEEAIYAAKNIEPAVKVSFAGVVLAKDSDYVVTYSEAKEVGEVVETYIAFKGNYAGNDTLHTAIIARQLTADMVSIAAGPFTYTGKEITPAVTVVDAANDYTLVAGTDYEVEYLNNVYGGYGSAIVKGIGNYTGRVRMTFFIDGPDALNNLDAEHNAQKVFINDRLYIIRGEHMFDVDGRLVK